MSAVPKTLGEALENSKRILIDANHEAEFILSHVFHGSKRIDLYSHSADTLTGSQWDTAEALTFRRALGEPLQYLLGNQVFLDHRYEVGQGVLIPRPETEVLVTEAIKIFRSFSPKKGMEIGLGSGAISIELLSALPSLTMYGSEVSAIAATFAQKNANQILGSGSSRLKILRASESSDVFGAFSLPGELGEKFDFLISNPPYLASDDEIEGQVLQHEPRLALFPESGDSLYFYSEFARASKEYLVDNGLILVEIPSNRAKVIVSLFENEGWTVSLISDLTGRDRVLVARRNEGVSRVNKNG